MTPENERERIRQALHMLADMPAEDIAAFHVEAESEKAFWAKAADASQWELLRRMEEEGADQQVAGDYLLTRVGPQNSYEWDVETLSEVKPLLPQGEWEKAVQPVPTAYKVATAKVKAWAKFGNRAAAIIERAHTTRPRGNAHVEVTEVKYADIPGGVRS